MFIDNGVFEVVHDFLGNNEVRNLRVLSISTHAFGNIRNINNKNHGIHKGSYEHIGSVVC